MPAWGEAELLDHNVYPKTVRYGVKAVRDQLSVKDVTANLHIKMCISAHEIVHFYYFFQIKAYHRDTPS